MSGSTVGATGGPGSTPALPTGASTDWWSPNYGYKTVTTNVGTKKQVYTNPAGLGQQLGQTTIQGVWDLLGSTFNEQMNAAAAYGAVRTPANNLTADQAMALFEQASGTTLTNIQLKLYQAGLYSGKDIPTFGIFQKADKDAFRKMLIGLASSPTQGAASGYLDAIASAYSSQPTRAPLVIKHVDDKVLTATFQQAATNLLGEFLPKQQLDSMIAAYHQAESTNAKTAYDLGDPSLTGTLGGAGGDANITPSPTEYAAANLQGENPAQYAAHGIGSMVMSALDSLRTTGYLPSGG